MGLAYLSALNLTLGELRAASEQEPMSLPGAPATRRPTGHSRAGLALSVVIPVYNEEDNVRPLLKSLRDVMEGLGRPYEVIVVDDGSTDKTRARLRELTVELPALRVVRLRANFGQTAALAAGFDLARGALVVTLDGDGQNDPADIPRLRRQAEGGVRRRQRVASRSPGSLLVAAAPLAGRPTGSSRASPGSTSTTTGARSRSTAGRSSRTWPSTGRCTASCPPSATGWARRSGSCRSATAPRRRGVSKYGLGRMVRVLLDLLTVKFLMSYWTRPIQIFGLLGLVLGGSASAVGALLSYQKIVHGLGLANRPLLLLAVLLVLVGFQFVSIGLLGEMLVRTYHESQRKPIYTVREIISGGQS